MSSIDRNLDAIAFVSDHFREIVRRRLSELGGVGLLTLALITAIALGTWSVQDPSLSHATNAKVHNLLGAPGAIAADLMMQMLGLAAAMVLMPLALTGWRLLAHRELGGKLRQLVWIGALLLSSAFFACLPKPKYSGTRSRASPVTPPSPVGSGQLPGFGRQPKNAAASGSATNHTSCRSFPPKSRCAKSRQPVSASGISTIAAASPSICIIRSAAMAPGAPSRLCTFALVAWLKEGSCTDQVASAIAVISASVMRPTPASSLRRRRTISRKWSETKAMASRLRSIDDMKLTQYGDDALERFGGRFLVLHHGHANIVGAGI